MKNLLLAGMLLVSLKFNGVCQNVADTSKVKLSQDLKLKLKEINLYVHKLDSIKLLMINAMDGELTSGGNIETREYCIDSLHRDRVKSIYKTYKVQQTTTSISYYKDNHIIYLKTILDELNKSNYKETYYENNKIIYTSN